MGGRSGGVWAGWGMRVGMERGGGSVGRGCGRNDNKLKGGVRASGEGGAGDGCSELGSV